MNVTRNFGTFRMCQHGFTLIELISVIILLGILSAYALLNTGATPAEMTVPSQARRLASDIRYAQTLAVTSGKPMQLSAATAGSADSYTVACVADEPGCISLTVNLEKGVQLAGQTTIAFNTLGVPMAPGTYPASYTLSVDGSGNHMVTVAALTGFVTVTSP